MTLPLSSKLRPEALSDILGQEHLTAPGQPIHEMLTRKKPLSFLLWGPPGSGKTSIARLFAKAVDLPFLAMSGSDGSISSLKALIKEQESTPLFGRKHLVFVDEIHRFSKLQQDAFLPLIEEGRIFLIGATTENPSFAINSALLSRLRVFTLRPLPKEALQTLVTRISEKEAGLSLTTQEIEEILSLSQGDARALINFLEEKLSLGTIGAPVRKIVYDKDGEQHYNTISALHKSIRASDSDGALFWLCRMLQGGEDPHFIFRRLIRAASEDVGLADPEALSVVLACYNSYTTLGSPEGDLAIAQATLYLTLAPKSAAIYKAFNEAKEKAKNFGYLPPPIAFINSPTKFMKEEGFGKGYLYDHDFENGVSGQSGLPQELGDPKFYRPVDRGFERELKKRLDYFRALQKRGDE